MKNNPSFEEEIVLIQSKLTNQDNREFMAENVLQREKQPTNTRKRRASEVRAQPLADKRAGRLW